MYLFTPFGLLLWFFCRLDLSRFSSSIRTITSGQTTVSLPLLTFSGSRELAIVRL
jgi:hypothetical protein